MAAVLGLRDYGPGEVSAIGEALYRRHLRARLDTPENLGKLLMLDIESTDFEITDDLHEAEAAEKLRRRRPEAVVYTLRIGYVATEAVGGGLTRHPDEAALDVA